MAQESLIERAGTQQFVAFTLNGQQYALGLSSVERIVRMVEVTALPKTPEIVLGLIYFEGRPVPVLDMRSRFSLPPQKLDWNGKLIIAHTATRTVRFPVDSVIGVIQRNQLEIIPPEKIVTGIAYVSGVTRLDDGMLLIHDLDRFLSLEEETHLDRALAQA